MRIATQAQEARGKRANRFDVEQFVDYEEPPDPAGLCDGGDYVRRLQIRLEDDDTVSCFWQDAEYKDHECVENVPYEKFYRAIVPVLRRLRGRKL